MNDKNNEHRRPTGRKLAEWITLCASIVLVAAVAAYLVYDAARPQPPSVPVEVRVLTEEARAQGEMFVVPMDVRNRGRRTLRNLKLLVSSQTGGGGGGGGGATERQEVTVDYLGEGANETIYLYFDRDPRQLKITAQPFAYQLR